MIRCSRVAALLTLTSIGSWGAASSSAAPISTATFAPIVVVGGIGTGSETMPYTVSSTDIGQTDGIWSLVSGTFNPATSLTRLNDGFKYSNFPIGNGTSSLLPSDGMVAQLTFSQLFDIDRIESLTAYSAERTGQAYVLQYSTDGVNFSLLHTVGGELDNSDAANVETRVTVADSLGGKLATNVKALRFTFSNVGATIGESIYREIDVFGTPAAAALPEPSVLAICGMAGLALPLIVRRRRLQA